MREVNAFISERLPEGHQSFRHCQRVSPRGGGAGVVLWGERIAAQFEVKGCYIVVTSYDYYEGVSHWFYVLDKGGVVLDEASTPDYFGFIDAITIDGPDTLSFGFFGTHDRWTLSFHEGGVWSFRWRDFAPRFNRHFLGRRYLTLDCTKGQPWTASGSTSPDLE